MKKIYIRIFSLLLALLILTAVVFMSGCDKPEPPQEYIPITWTADEENDRIYGNEKAYDLYYYTEALYFDCRTVFCFMNDIEYNGSLCKVYGDSADPHIVSVELDNGEKVIFTDLAGRRILDRSLGERKCIYYLEENDEVYTVLDKDTLADLDDYYYANHDNFEYVNVSSLKKARILEITVHDELEHLSYEHGAVYIMPNGTYYYVCFEFLKYTCFDADGFFSYQSGTVKALVLDSDFQYYVDREAKKMKPKNQLSINEYDVYTGTVDVYGNPND